MEASNQPVRDDVVPEGKQGRAFRKSSPAWARPGQNEDGKTAAKRYLDEKYGPGNWDEEMLRKVMSERFIMNGYHTKMAMWLKAIYHHSGVARTPEETIFRAYDTMAGVEKPAFAKA